MAEDNIQESGDLFEILRLIADKTCNSGFFLTTNHRGAENTERKKSLTELCWILG
ncbi:hypothetical protein GXM_06151 [Nostoc sphaeroides CCNUC1]|uniref:Uncharacterized protein n=1 Tax=Nostoc sphaeroides CCNUC1 TaxID=2653204 RepID=A0A5P8W7B2_9NOSO|nr:hypothetical protein GXM_06151 [Nostoc sphaeroides CCNUC1]